MLNLYIGIWLMIFIIALGASMFYYEHYDKHKHPDEKVLGILIILSIFWPLVILLILGYNVADAITNTLQ